MKKLADTLKQNNILLILKMHPQVEKDSQYLAMKDLYGNHPNFYFWENKDDVYEIFSDIDIAIVDYSSIFYDLLARGVKTFIRYFYDIDCKENFRDFVFDLREMTCGTEATNFEELLAALTDCPQTEQSEINRINDIFWSYSDEDDCERIIAAALSFTPPDRQFPKLYSFDIFDTLFPDNAFTQAVFLIMSNAKWKIPLSDITPTSFVSLRKSGAGARQTCENITRSQRSFEKMTGWKFSYPKYMTAWQSSFP